MSDTETPQLNTEPSLGRQLRSRREERGLSIEDVAHHLKIDASLLRDFEEEREPSHNLPEVYCKGFLRNYARYLRVTIEPGQIKACRTSDIRLNERGEEYNPRRPLLPYLLIAAVVVGAGLFFFGGALNHSDQAEEKSATEQTAQPATANSRNSSTRSASAVVETAAQAKIEKSENVEKSEEITAAEQTEAAFEPAAERAPAAPDATEASSTEGQEAAIASDSTPEPVTEAPAESVTAEADGAVTEESVESTELPPPTASRGTVTIRYIDRSFTQITDGLGRVIVKRMLDAGAVEDFEGPLPLQINLGNAIGVRVKFNGEPFDHLNYIDDNNIAQFLLGGAE